MSKSGTKAQKRKTTTGRPTSSALARRRAKRAPAPAEGVALAPVSALDPEIVDPAAVEVTLPLSIPEPALAARRLPAEPDRPLPPTHRAIFFDVENTSRAEHITRVIDHLAVDRSGRRTEFFAVGNWKVVGHDTARLLARRGAHLVHSAPSVGVRDWSDLRIAVSAGVWLATARPGDVIEVVSDDRAFDAVGDVAASLGIEFRRLSYRALAGGPAVEEPARAEPEREREPRGGRRRRGRRRDSRAPSAIHAPAAHAPAARAPAVHVRAPHVVVEPPRTEPAPEPAETGAHTAPHDEIVGVARDLIQASPTGGVTIDTLANALKSRGFRRTSGSPRLITRLRRIREITISRAGLITLSGDAAGENGGEPTRAPAPAAARREPVERPAGRGAEEADDDIGNRVAPGSAPRAVPGSAPPEAPASQEQRRRRSRRGGRHRRGRRGGATTAPV